MMELNVQKLNFDDGIAYFLQFTSMLFYKSRVMDYLLPIVIIYIGFKWRQNFDKKKMETEQSLICGASFIKHELINKQGSSILLCFENKEIECK